MLVYIIGGLVTFTAFFLLGREIIWWYFGIGRTIAVLEDIAVSLRTLPSVREYDAYLKRPARKAA